MNKNIIHIIGLILFLLALSIKVAVPVSNADPMAVDPTQPTNPAIPVPLDGQNNQQPLQPNDQPQQQQTNWVYSPDSVSTDDDAADQFGDLVGLFSGCEEEVTVETRHETDSWTSEDGRTTITWDEENEYHDDIFYRNLSSNMTSVLTIYDTERVGGIVDGYTLNTKEVRTIHRLGVYNEELQQNVITSEDFTSVIEKYYPDGTLAFSQTSTGKNPTGQLIDRAGACTELVTNPCVTDIERKRFDKRGNQTEFYKRHDEKNEYVETTETWNREYYGNLGGRAGFARRLSKEEHTKKTITSKPSEGPAKIEMLTELKRMDLDGTISFELIKNDNSQGASRTIIEELYKHDFGPTGIEYTESTSTIQNITAENKSTTKSSMIEKKYPLEEDKVLGIYTGTKEKIKENLSETISFTTQSVVRDTHTKITEIHKDITDCSGNYGRLDCSTTDSAGKLLESYIIYRTYDSKKEEDFVAHTNKTTIDQKDELGGSGLLYTEHIERADTNDGKGDLRMVRLKKWYMLTHNPQPPQPGVTPEPPVMRLEHWITAGSRDKATEVVATLDMTTGFLIGAKTFYERADGVVGDNGWYAVNSYSCSELDVNLPCA